MLICCKRKVVYVAVVTVVALVVQTPVATQGQTETPTTEYQNIMKSMFGAIRNRGDDYKAIEKDAATLQANFAKLERFWTEQKIDDAIGFAKAGASAALYLEMVAKFKNAPGIKAAREELLSTCVACHVAHVERLTNTTFAIRYGASGESPAKSTAAPESARIEPSNGVTPPVPTNIPRPKYTADAMRVLVQGVVWVECIVQTTGACTDTHVVRSLDPVFGLDQEALKAANQFRFKPGMLQSQPVAVLVTIELSFRLH